VRTRRWIHPDSFFRPFHRLLRISDLVGRVGFRGTSTESRWRERTSLTREKARERENDRERILEGEGRGREKERESLYLGASFICRDLFYGTHARTLTATHSRVLGTVCPAEWKNVIFSDKWTVAACGRDVRLNAIVYFVLDCSLISICDVPPVYRS